MQEQVKNTAADSSKEFELHAVEDGEIFRPEIKVDKRSHQNAQGKPVTTFHVESGLQAMIAALSCPQAMEVTLCLPGHVWLMLRQVDFDIEATISHLIEDSVELRQRWMNEACEGLCLREAIAANDSTAA